MDLLVVTADVPATSAMPGSPRLVNLCRHLSARHKLVLLTGCSDPVALARLRAESDRCGVFSEIAVLPAKPAVRWWNRQAHRVRAAANLHTRYRYPEYHRTLRTLVNGRLATMGPSALLYVDGLEMTQYYTGDPRRALVDLHDSPSLVATQALGMERSRYRRLSLRLERHRMVQWECALATSFAAIIVNSPVDQAVTRALSPRANTWTVSNGIDTEFFQPAAAPATGSAIVFTGVMDYKPNADAVHFFCDAIFPIIQAALPDTEFWAVGANPSAALQDLNGRPGVHVTGTVADVRPYLRSAAVFVCPLRFGSGMKNKILAAMAMRLPVIATPISLAGIDVRPGCDVLMAEAPEEFAENVVRLLADRDESRSLAEAGHARVLQHYSWQAKAATFDTVLEKLADHLLARQGA